MPVEPEASASPSPKRKMWIPHWWQIAIPVTLLIIAGYRMSKYQHYIKAEGLIRDVKITTTQNRTVEGCVVVYQYQIQYTDQTNRIYFAERTHSSESRTCRTDEIKPGDRESIYYNPANPADPIESPVDTWSLGLLLFSAFGLLTVLITWLTRR